MADLVLYPVPVLAKWEIWRGELSGCPLSTLFHPVGPGWVYVEVDPDVPLLDLPPVRFVPFRDYHNRETS